MVLTLKLARPSLEAMEEVIQWVTEGMCSQGTGWHVERASRVRSRSQARRHRSCQKSAVRCTRWLQHGVNGDQRPGHGSTRCSLCPLLSLGCLFANRALPGARPESADSFTG